MKRTIKLIVLGFFSLAAPVLFFSQSVKLENTKEKMQDSTLKLYAQREQLKRGHDSTALLLHLLNHKSEVSTMPAVVNLAAEERTYKDSVIRYQDSLYVILLRLYSFSRSGRQVPTYERLADSTTAMVIEHYASGAAKDAKNIFPQVSQQLEKLRGRNEDLAVWLARLRTHN